MRIIGLDIHRAFAEAVAWDDGKLKRLGRVDMRRPLLEAFAKKLSKDDVVVVEATGNAASVSAVIAPHVKKVVIANPKQVRVIAHAKIKTDTIDASVLAQLYASGFLPEVWIPDEPSTTDSCAIPQPPSEAAEDLPAKRLCRLASIVSVLIFAWAMMRTCFGFAITTRFTCGAITARKIATLA